MFFCFNFFVFGEKVSCDIRNCKQLLEEIYEFKALVSYNYMDFITGQKKNADQMLEIYNRKLICIDSSLWQIPESQNLYDYRVGHRQDKVLKYYI
jgi:uridine kinase